jgi:hypothetical protein
MENKAGLWHEAENVSGRKESLERKIESFLNTCLEVTNRGSSRAL